MRAGSGDPQTQQVWGLAPAIMPSPTRVSIPRECVRGSCAGWPLPALSCPKGHDRAGSGDPISCARLMSNLTASSQHGLNESIFGEGWEAPSPPALRLCRTGVTPQCPSQYEICPALGVTKCPESQQTSKVTFGHVVPQFPLWMGPSRTKSVTCIHFGQVHTVRGRWGN